MDIYLLLLAGVSETNVYCSNLCKSARESEIRKVRNTSLIHYLGCYKKKKKKKKKKFYCIRYVLRYKLNSLGIFNSFFL